MRTNDMGLSNYTKSGFDDAYKFIRENLTLNKRPGREHCTVILGGQPGAGKSFYYKMNGDLDNDIVISGDDYRIYHPNYDLITKYEPELFPELTQTFVNSVVEKLIDDLGSKGYNLIIEGTLRNPTVSINTCETLKKIGYRAELVVVACDAEKAWNSTITRALNYLQDDLFPRLVPIEIYNHTVHQITQSLETISSRGCFDSITIINREGEILYRGTELKSPSKVLKEELNLENWDAKYHFYEEKYIEDKEEILERFRETWDTADDDIDNQDAIDEDEHKDDIEDDYERDDSER